MQPRIFPLTYRELEKLGITFCVGLQLFADRTKVEFKRYTFVYDEVQDLYRYSNGKTLRVGTCTANAGGVDRKYWGGAGGLPELSLLGQMSR